MQLPIQIAGAVATAAWSLVLSIMLVFAFELAHRHFLALGWHSIADIFQLRVKPDAEIEGIDPSQVGDYAVSSITS